jgi:hypothetical protein
MAIWQFRLVFIPEEQLLHKYDILPPSIPMELAEEFDWWSLQPPPGLEEHIDMILPQAESWSNSMRMWGRKHGDDAYICYVDERKKTIEEIAFRIDAHAPSRDLVCTICALARKLRCVLLTSDYNILAPDETMVFDAIKNSTAKNFVDDPVSTLQNLDHRKIQDKFEYLLRNPKTKPRRKE